MTNTWFTSDTHFGHARIIELCGRPFDSVDAMNEAIIDNWNAVVKPDDFVIHMGDVAMGTLAESLPLVGRLNGVKALVPGNHDRIFSENKPAYRKRFLPAYQDVFDLIWQEYTYLMPYGFDVCHFPFEGDSHEEDRHADLRPVDRGSWLIHGHVHTEWKVRGRQINVGVDVWDFTPVHLDQIMEVIGNG
jgi:calcineurin-like phosphoesterase family protein